MFGCRCRIKHLARFCRNSRWLEAMRREWWGCQGLSWIGEGLACLVGCIAPRVHCPRTQLWVKLWWRLKTCLFGMWFVWVLKMDEDVVCYIISFKLLYLTTRSQFIRWSVLEGHACTRPVGWGLYQCRRLNTNFLNFSKNISTQPYWLDQTLSW